MSKIKGGHMHLFLDGKSIAFSTTHTLSISAEAVDVSNKDEGGGDWSSQEVGTLSWSASSENLYSIDTKSNGKDFAALFDLMVAKTPITAVFCKRNEADTVTEVPETGWTPQTGAGYEGKVIITSLELNAQNGEYATFSVDFQGVGALKKKTA